MRLKNKQKEIIDVYWNACQYRLPNQQIVCDYETFGKIILDFIDQIQKREKLLQMKKPYSFKLDESLLSELQSEAKSDNRPFNNYVENLLLTHPARGGFKAKKPSTKRKLK